MISCAKRDMKEGRVMGDVKEGMENILLYTKVSYEAVMFRCVRVVSSHGNLHFGLQPLSGHGAMTKTRKSGCLGTLGKPQDSARGRLKSYAKEWGNK